VIAVLSPPRYVSRGQLHPRLAGDVRVCNPEGVNARQLASELLPVSHFDRVVIEVSFISPVDGFLNSAMLLGGMRPVTMPQTTAGKLFAGCYALYSGLLFIVTAAVMVTPVAHRLLHRFHWEADE